MPASINEILAPDIFEAGGVSGLWPSPPAITQPHHVTSVDRCSCCRQTNHHSTFGLVSLLCPSLRSLWTLISTLGPLHCGDESLIPTLTHHTESLGFLVSYTQI